MSTTALERMLASTESHPGRAYFECACGFTMIDDSDDPGFDEDLWQHQETCPGPDPAPTVGDPMVECARCSSTETYEVRDHAGVALLVRCVTCGHVLSLVALRALAGRLGQAPAVDLAEELHRLVGVPFWPVSELQGVGEHA